MSSQYIKPKININRSSTVLSGILLVAGTCIGSGIIALPLSLAKIGILPSILLMLVIWCVIFYTALVSLELNLQAKKGLALGALCKKFSGKIAGIIGTSSIKILCYSLLSAYIYSGSSVVEQILINDIIDWKLLYILIIAGIFLLPKTFIKNINSILFISLIGVIGLLLGYLMFNIKWRQVTLIGPEVLKIMSWISIIPVVFTSFGFQVIFHTMTNQYKNNAATLKRVFLLGSIIPAIVYIIWNSIILAAIQQYSPDFYQQMSNDNADIGDLVSHLASIAQLESIQLMILWISSLAIATSIIGVGIGLFETIEQQMHLICKNYQWRRIIALIVTLLPPYIITIYIPNAFISVLGFAGLILAVIAIILPIFLLFQLHNRTLYYSLLKKQFFIIILMAAGIIIILCEIINIAKKLYWI